MEPREKIQEDERFINCFTSELHNAGILHVPFPPAVDEVTRALGEVHKTKKIPLWLVFAVQLVLDIKGVLRKDIQIGFSAMQTTGQCVKSVIQTHFRTARGLLWRKETWHSDNDNQILQLVGFVAAWVNADLMTKAIKRQCKQDLEECGVEPAPFWLLKNHPLLCGLMVYFMNISIRELGISVSNAYDSILSVGHLYTAAKQSGPLPQPWPDMEYLISVQTARRLFVGGLPTTPGDFFKRCQLATGASPVCFVRNTRNAKPRQSAKDASSYRLRKTSPIHEIFVGRMRLGEKRVNLSTRNLESLLATETFTQSPANGPLRWICDDFAQIRRLSPPQLLFALEQGLTADDMHLHFDYVAMHKRCVDLLQGIRTNFISKATAMVPVGYHEDLTR